MGIKLTCATRIDLEGGEDIRDELQSHISNSKQSLDVIEMMWVHSVMHHILK